MLRLFSKSTILIITLSVLMILQQFVIAQKLNVTTEANDVVKDKNITSTTTKQSKNTAIITTTAPKSTTTTNITKTTKSPMSNITKPVITKPTTITDQLYCKSSLCELYNGTHIILMPHIGCLNNGSFGQACGAKPHLLYMSERRRNLIIGLHNLARSRIALGQVDGYKPASHMPVLKWDNELEYLAMLHVKRCQFAHDQCRNTPRFSYSGQNIGYFWIGREFKSHSKRMKSFIINWFREYNDANQTFIDKFHFHPEGKKIGHFTMMVSDRAHRIGCAAVRFRDPSQPIYMKFLMTCNYDFNNLLGEPIYQSGPTASKCAYKISEQFPALCDWKDPVYDYDSEESAEDSNLLDNKIPF